MKTILYMLIGSLVGIYGISNVEASIVDSFDIVYVENDELLKLDGYKSADNNPKFYINEDFLNHNTSSYKNVSLIENKEIIDEEKLILAGIYDFNYGGLEYVGEIYGTVSSSIDSINNKIVDIMNQIDNNTYFDNHSIDNITPRLQGGINVDSNWKVINERRIDLDCTNDGEHFGDVVEWRTTFQLTDSNTNYYSFINETFIKPDPNKTDYRTSSLVCKFKSDLGVTAQLRNYEPRMKNNDATIEYNVNVGTSVSSNISVSYNTLVDSPRVYDNGNLANNYGEVYFDYLNTFDNAGEYYDYNIGQSYQVCTFIIKVDTQTGKIITKQDRTIGIQRDGFWSNKLVHFNYESEVYVER